MWEFIENYFIKPVYSGEGYNIFNTLVYGALFIIGLHGIKWTLNKWKIKINKELFHALLPYLFVGGLVRAIQDYSPIKHWLFITPGIYLLMTGVVISILLATGKDLTKIKKIGWVLAAASAGLVTALAYSSAFNIQWVFAIIGVAVLATALVSTVFKDILKTTENKIVAFGQILDASASTIPIAFLGYGEQHIVSALIMDANPFLFPIVKIALVLMALRLIDQNKGEWNWLLKIAIVTLGIAPGMRDLARVFMGV